MRIRKKNPRRIPRKPGKPAGDRVSTLEQAEERAEQAAARLGYELAEWNKRWHYRSTKWNPGVWFARDFATKLKALDHLVQRMGSGIRERR